MSKIKAKECQNVEFKTSWNDKYLEWICGNAKWRSEGDNTANYVHADDKCHQ